MNILKVCLLLLLSTSFAFAQKNTDNTFAENIKTVRFYSDGMPLSYPVIELNSNAQLRLSFDDLDGDVKDYSYTIQHCNADWMPSELSTLEYIDGFETEQILDFEYSFNTLVEYTNFQLTLPNDNMKFTKSGNYVLKVFLDDTEEVVLTRRFMVLEPLVTVAADLVRPHYVGKARTHQEIDFIVNHPNLDIRAPREDIKVAVLQNGRWDTAIQGLKPLFVRGTQLMYDYQDKVVFPAGREFRSVDLRSTRFRTANVERLESDRDMYYMYVRPDRVLRQIPYLFEQDINGKFIIENLHENNDDLESDYITTFFQLNTERPFENGSLYLFGEMTDWQIKEDFELSFVPSKGGYLLKTLLKQGFYNYKYAFVKDSETTISHEPTEGDFFDAENNYQIFVYYRPFGGRYDQLICVETFNSLD